MPRYKVVLSELASYTVYVEAENEDDAMEKAEDKFVTHHISEFECEVHNRDADHVELDPAPETPDYLKPLEG
jgi:hypothetical protein